MDLNEIGEIIKEDGGKFIIIEDGKPSFVVMSFDEYKKRISVKSNSSSLAANPVFNANMPKEITEAKKFEPVSTPKPSFSQGPVSESKLADNWDADGWPSGEEIKLEDLPL